jgi:hypothetical protein
VGGGEEPISPPEQAGGGGELERPRRTARGRGSGAGWLGCWPACCCVNRQNPRAIRNPFHSGWGTVLERGEARRGGVQFGDSHARTSVGPGPGLLLVPSLRERERERADVCGGGESMNHAGVLTSSLC